MRVPLSVAALALAATSCSAQPAAESAPAQMVEPNSTRHAESGLEVIPLTVTSGETVHEFTVEVADTAEAQARGLMFRTELGPQEGMVFPYPAPTILSFWMKNTPLPLDIIFIAPDRRILNIAAMTTPYSTESVTSAGAANAVLEIPGGRAEELGIGPGDLVEW